MNQILALQETKIVLDDALAVLFASGRFDSALVQKRLDTAKQIIALRDKRLKRFSTAQLNLRLGKLAAFAPERIDIITEIQFRSHLQ